MLSDNEVKKKFDILANKLRVGLHNEVISETTLLLKKREHQVFFNILSLAYQSIGEFQKSADVMERALKKNANNPYFLNNMGVSQHKLENFSQAEEYFKKGLRIAPNYINILNNLGNLKNDLNFTEEAIELYKKSISIKNDIIETHHNIANCYQSIGKYEESIFHCNEILKINPKITVSDRLISSMKKYVKEDPHLNKMESKLDEYDLNEEQLSNLYFGIGKAYEDIKDYKKSFDNYNQGNKLLKKLNPFDIENEKKKFIDIKNFFTNNEPIQIKLNSRKLIFIVGMPRSGTSLVEQILSSHDNVYGGGELPFLTTIIKNNFLEKFRNIEFFKIPKINQIISECQNEYIKKTDTLDNSNKDFTDKTPLNFRYIGFIKNIFPNSKVINCKRDILDTSWSNFKNYFPASLPFTNNLFDLANYFKLYTNLMIFWKEKYPNDIYDIEYEKLVNSPKSEVENLLKFCELKWDKKCMSHQNNFRSIKTASATQARQPIYKSAIKSSDLVKKYLGELLENL